MRHVPPPLAPQPDNPDPDAMQAATERAAADLAAVYGTTPEEAAAELRRVLTDPTPPFISIGLYIDFRWWERPRRLWRRRALARTARIGFGDVEL